MLARCAGCGVAAAGGTALMSDAPCASAGAWLGRYYKLPVTLFVQQDGDGAELRLFGPDGLPLRRAEQRKIEGALLRGEGSRVAAMRVGWLETVAGVRPGYAADAAHHARLSSIPLRLTQVQVEKGEGANDLLCAALTALGCQVRRGSGRGAPTFSADWGGFRLTAWDEEGRLISPDRVLVLLTRIEMEQGRGAAALPSWAPAAAEQVAESFQGRLLRLGRDGEEAEALWREQPWFWDGIFAACRIAARLGLTGETLSHLDQGLPHFSTVRGEVPLRTGRGRVMGRALEALSAQPQGEGARLRVGEGWVYVVPSSSRNALRLIVEAADMEAAEELCGAYEKKLRELDRE